MRAAVFHGDRRISIVESVPPEVGVGEVSFYFPISEFAANVELMRANRERYRRVVDAQFPIDELPARFERFMAGGLVKPEMVC
ncbi:MAG: hypothetical protein ABI854_06785 [Betaproteobacteria bacterium]